VIDAYCGAGFFAKRVVARLQRVVGIDWDVGDWSSTLTGNYTGGFLRAFSPADLSCPYSAGAHPDLCRVKAWSTADLYVAYKGIKNLTLGANVDYGWEIDWLRSLDRVRPAPTALPS